MNFGAIEKPVLVIGYGNALRGDDGIGPAAARRLRRTLPKTLASVVAAHQLLPELAEPVSRADLVIFIDADSKIPAGLFRREALPAAGSGITKAIGHHQTPQGILHLAGEIYGHRPRAMLYSIGGEDFGYGRKLSRPVRAALEEVTRDVAETVIAFSRTCSRLLPAGPDRPALRQTDDAHAVRIVDKVPIRV